LLKAFDFKLGSGLNIDTSLDHQEKKSCAALR